MFYYLPGEVALINVSVDVSLFTISSCVVLTVVDWPKISSKKLKLQVLKKTEILNKFQLWIYFKIVVSYNNLQCNKRKIFCNSLVFKVSNVGSVVVSGVTIVSFVVLATSDIPKILLNILLIDICITV